MSKSIKKSKVNVPKNKERDLLTPVLDKIIGARIDAAFRDCLRAAIEQSKWITSNADISLKDWCREYVSGHIGGPKLEMLHSSATYFFVFGTIYFIAKLIETSITLLGN